ncbi:MAG: GNAT family N-acetyltransferase [Thalassovita sp.]
MSAGPKPVAHLYEVIDGTWPAAECQTIGPWMIRNGQDGGQRVSAATALGAVTAADITSAEHAMQSLGQPRLFQIRAGDEALDQQLDARGYVVVDPVNLWLAPVADLATDRPPPVTSFSIWPPLAIQREIWLTGGIGPGRLAVMDRAEGAKVAILGRVDDSPAGTAFVAIHDGTAMLHALEVLPKLRRKGLALWILRQAAFWALENGAQHFSVLCTKANEPANALYSKLGMSFAGEYHYRRHQDDLS